MPVVLKTLPGAWLQQTEKGTAWKLSDDDVAKSRERKRPAQSYTKSGGKAAAASCCARRVPRRRLGDESDARRTIDEVALASQAELPADNERDAAVREAAAIAKDVDWGRLPPLCEEPRPGPWTDGRPPP